MNPIADLSLADFNRQLREYCTSAVAIEEKEKVCISRLEKIIEQRDACLEYIANEKKRNEMLCEDIEDLKYQREDALEFLQVAEKRYNKFAAKQPPSPETPDVVETTSNEPEDDKCPDEQIFRRILRKYCNIYVQFNKRSNTIRVLSLEDNSYLELALSDNSGDDDLRARIWSKLESSSMHLSTWEKLL